MLSMDFKLFLCMGYKSDKHVMSTESDAKIFALYIPRDVVFIVYYRRIF